MPLLGSPAGAVACRRTAGLVVTAGWSSGGLVLRRADILADRRVFVLDEAAWHECDQALERPAADVPGLSKLLSERTVLDPPGPDDQPGD